MQFPGKSELVDSLIPHANGAEISAFYSTGESVSASASKSNQVDLEDSIKEVEEEAFEELVEDED